jgi:tetratricopeptide (TPR) repeat protein
LTRYESMATGLDNQALLGAFYSRRGACEWWFGNLDKAVKTLTKAAELCDAVGEKENAGMAYMTLQWSYLCKGDFAQVLTLKEAAPRVMSKQFGLRPYVLALTGASWAYSHMGSWDSAVREAQNGLSAAEEQANTSLISFAAFAISIAHTLRGDLSKALEYGELAVQNAPTTADKVWAQTGLAMALCRLGDPHKGIELATNLLSMYQAVRFLPAEIYTIITLGEGYRRCGDNDVATQRLYDGLELAERTGMRFLIGYAHRLLGETALKDNPEQAMNHFKQSISTFQEIKGENELALAYAGYGRIHKRQGNMEQAREYLMKSLEIFERLGTLIEPDNVKEDLTRLPSGK